MRKERNQCAYNFHRQGFTYAEIAKMVGTSPAIIKQYIDAHSQTLKNSTKMPFSRRANWEEHALTLSVPHPKLSKIMKWHEVPLGVTSDGEEVVWQMLPNNTGLLIYGTTGSGKSVTLQNILFHANQYPRNEIKILMCDPLGNEFLPPKSTVNEVQVSKEFPDVLETICEVEKETRDRKVALTSEGVHNFTELSNVPPAILLVIREPHILFPGSPAELEGCNETLREEVLAKITTIAQFGHSTGIYLVVVTQKADKQSLPSQILGDLDIRITHGDTSEIREILGADEFTDEPFCFGRAVWCPRHKTLVPFQPYRLSYLP